jgi:hypothetical protein
MTETRELLRLLRGQTIDPDDAHFQDLLEIIRDKPSWLKHLEKVRKFKIAGPNLLVQVVPGRWWRAAWRANPRKVTYSYQLQSALRHAVRIQISQWKRANTRTSECVECQTRVHLQADHKTKSFWSLSQEFLQKEGHDSPVSFDYHRLGRKFQTSDVGFVRRWQLYHRSQCDLQWLCKKCNIAKGKAD